MRRFVHGKIHGLRVTRALLRYHGSVTVDHDLLQRAGIDPFEAVDLVNLSTGARWTTYVIPGDTGEFWLNGGSARLGAVGDECLIITYEFADEFTGARVVMVDEGNRPLDEFTYDPEPSSARLGG